MYILIIDWISLRIHLWILRKSHAGKAKSFQAYAAALAELRRLVPASLGSFKKIQVLVWTKQRILKLFANDDW